MYKNVFILFLLIGINLIAQPTSMTYQGRLLESGTPVNGTRNFQITIYDLATGGNVLVNTQTFNGTQVTNGLYNLVITGLNPANFVGNTAYLQINVNGTDLSPRTQLLTVPYAFKAGIIDGVTSSSTELNLLDGIANISSAVDLGNSSPSNSVIPTQAAVKSYVDSKANTIAVPAGTITAYGGTTAPAGWLLCNETSLDRTTYSALFTAIGTAFGAADGTHFNVPDLRGMFLRGAGTSGSRTDANNVSFAGGSVGDYQQDKFQSHYHHFEYAFNDGGGSLTKPYYAGTGTTLYTSNDPVLQKVLAPTTD